MFKLKKLILVFFFLTITLAKELHRCEKDDDCLNNYLCHNNYCEHKNLFPVNFGEIFVLIFMSGLSMVATTAGIGGGAVYSALLMFIENFPAMDAFPISTFIIFLCAIGTYYVGIRDKIENPQHKFVDYDLVLVFCPTMLLGTKIGVILNRIFPSLVLNILLILSLAFSSYKIYLNAVKQKAIEQLRAANESQPFKPQRKISLDEIYYEHYQESIIESPLKISKNSRGLGNSLFGKSLRNDFILLKDQINKIDFYAENSPVRLDRIKILLYLQLIFIIDQLIEGNDKFPSMLGINKCSMLYWMIFMGFVIFCIFYAKYCYLMIRDENKQSDINQGAEFNITSEEVDKIITKIMVICFLGGVMSGMLGVGGGIIMAPLMLELGLDPKTTASTSNFLLIFTSSSSLFLFILSKQLLFVYALFYGIPCVISSLIGCNFITKIVTRTGKNSILVYCLFYVMVISLIILPFNGIRHAVYDMKSNLNIFEFKSYC